MAFNGGMHFINLIECYIPKVQVHGDLNIK